MNIIGARTSAEQSKDLPPLSDEPLPKLNDGRQPGQWSSVYPGEAKFWIYAELCYLILLLTGTMVLLGICALSPLPPATVPLLTQRPFGTNEAVLFWVSVGSAGALGGTIMALKWHYHCVAKKLWHADRRVWRITTPLLSGVVSLFAVMLIASKFIAIFSVDQVTKPLGGVSLAFVLGLFSDNILAALQNFATRAFGTLRDKPPANRESVSGSTGDGE